MLVQIQRILGDSRDLEFTLDFTKYSTRFGLNGADITDIIFVVKKKKGDADNALLIKKASQGEITYLGQDVVVATVQWPANEYTGFEARKSYLAAIYPVFTGDTTADENTDEEFEIEIVDDTLKQN